MLSVKAMLDDDPVPIHKVQNRVRVFAFTGCEDDDFEHGGEVSKHVVQVLADFDI